MKYIEIKCSFCDCLFLRPLKQYKAESKKSGPNYKAYCSNKCMGAGSSFNKRITFNCETCGKETSVTKSKFNNVNHHFCSQSCSTSFNNKERAKNGYTTKYKFKKANCIQCKQIYDIGLHASDKKFICKICVPVPYKNNKITCKLCGGSFIGTKIRKFCDGCLPSIRIESGKKAGMASVKAQQRRSKNEIYFAELCATKFSDIQCNEPFFTDKRGDKWDADVIIHDIKVAVLWNGNWHYISIAKDRSLNQIQNRDKIKLSVIKSNGYVPYVIEDRGKENKKFVEEQFEVFLNYLKENKFGTIS